MSPKAGRLKKRGRALGAKIIQWPTAWISASISRDSSIGKFDSTLLLTPVGYGLK